MKSITLMLEDDVHKKLRIYLIKNDLTFKKFLTEAVNEKIAQVEKNQNTDEKSESNFEF